MPSLLPFPLSEFELSPEFHVHAHPGGSVGQHAHNPAGPCPGDNSCDVTHVSEAGRSPVTTLNVDADMLTPATTAGECGLLPFKLPTAHNDDHAETLDQTLDTEGPVSKTEAAALVPSDGAPVEHLAIASVVPAGNESSHGEYGPLPFKLPIPEEFQSLSDPLQQPVVPGCHANDRTGGSADSPEIISPRINLCPLTALDAESLMRLGCSHSTTQDAVATFAAPGHHHS